MSPISSSRGPKIGKLHKIRGNAYKPFTTDYTTDGRRYTQSLIKAVLLQERTMLDDIRNQFGPGMELEGNRAQISIAPQSSVLSSAAPTL